jgi:hypothetical protein
MRIDNGGDVNLGLRLRYSLPEGIVYVQIGVDIQGYQDL